MKLNYQDLQNKIIETIKNKNETVKVISAVVILYYNPTLYLTILGVCATYGLFKNFTYDINVDFKMKQLKNIEEHFSSNIEESNNINVENIDRFDDVEKNDDMVDDMIDDMADDMVDEMVDRFGEDINKKLQNSDNSDTDSDSDDSISELKKIIFSKSNDKFNNICEGEYFTTDKKD